MVDQENLDRPSHNDFQLIQPILSYMDDNESQQNDIPNFKKNSGLIEYQH